MKLSSDQIIDYGGAPEVCVTGASSIERISPGQIRESYFSRRSDGSVHVCSIVWDRELWRRHVEMLSRVCDEIFAEPPAGHEQPDLRIN
jgi:hypothetical protein